MSSFKSLYVLSKAGNVIINICFEHPFVCIQVSNTCINMISKKDSGFLYIFCTTLFTNSVFSRDSVVLDLVANHILQFAVICILRGLCSFSNRRSTIEFTKFARQDNLLLYILKTRSNNWQVFYRSKCSTKSCSVM